MASVVAASSGAAKAAVVAEVARAMVGTRAVFVTFLGSTSTL